MSDISEKIKEEFWLDYLSDIESSDLFFYHSKIKRELSYKIPDSITNRLNEVTKTKNSDIIKYLFYILAFKILHNRYTTKEKVLLGIGICDDPALDSFNQLFVRYNLDEELTVIETLNKVYDEFNKVVKQNNFSFDRVINRLKVNKISYEEEFFKYGLFYNRFLKKEDGFSKTFDVSIFIEENDDLKSNLHISFPDDIHKKIIDETIKCYLKILEGLLVDGKSNIKKIEHFDTIQKDKIYSLSTNADKGILTHTVIKLFEKKAKEFPDKLVLFSGKENLTYQKLNHKACQLAKVLKIKYEVKKDEVVAVCTEKSSDYIIAILGILKLGASYFTLNDENPIKKNKQLLNCANANLIICNSQNHNYVSSLGKKVVDINIIPFIHNEHLPEIDIKPTSVACVIPTSGTTGTPKLVEVLHQSIVRLVHHSNCIKLDSQDKILQSGDLTFDASLFEIWGALLNGASLFMYSKNELLDTLEEKIIQNKISIIWLTSSWFNNIVELNLGYLRMLKKLVIGGEKLSTYHVNKVLQEYPDIKIINGYGPTECTTFATCFTIDQKYERDIPIGKPINGTNVYVLNSNKNLLPIGVIGEIYISGICHANKYLNDAILTKEKFLLNPHDDFSTLYKTGDIGFWSSNGNLQIVGRKDQLIKIRGYRVELSEIESVLLSHKDVNEAVAVYDKGLIFVFIVSSNNITIEEIKLWVEGELPSFMIPSSIIRLERFYLTKNGKIDKKKLLEYKEAYVDKTEYSAPENLIELKLCSIWEKIFKKKIVGLDDNFFELGGHSLIASNLTQFLHKELGIVVEIKDIFKYPTIREQSSFINSLGKSKYSEIPRVLSNKHYKVSNSQIKVWMIDQREDDSRMYNIPISFTIEGDLKYEVFINSFLFVLKRHEVLRSTFKTFKGELRQFIETKLDNIDPYYSFIDLTTPQEGKTINELQEQIVLHKFDLNKGPLLKVQLLKLENKKFILSLNLHHIISDAKSLELIFSDLMKFYLNEINERKEVFPPLEIQYKDYVNWIDSLIVDKDLSLGKEYWSNVLNSFPEPLKLNMLTNKSIEKTYNGEMFTHNFDEDLWLKLNEVSRICETTVFSILFSGINILLYFLSNKNDIVLGIPVSGRIHPMLENQVGFYINTLPLRTKLELKKSFKDLLNKTKKGILDVIKNQLYPIDDLIEDLNLDFRNRVSLFDVVVQYLVEDHSFLNESLSVTTNTVTLNRSKYDLTFTFIESNGKLSLSLEYNTDVFDLTNIQMLLNFLGKILDTGLNQLDSSLEDLIENSVKNKNEQDIDIQFDFI